MAGRVQVTQLSHQQRDVPIDILDWYPAAACNNAAATASCHQTDQHTTRYSAGRCAAPGQLLAGAPRRMADPLPQGSDLASRLNEVNHKLEIAKRSETSSLDQLRAFASRGLPLADPYLTQEDLGQLGPALPNTMAQCMEELSSLQPAKDFTEALQVDRLAGRNYFPVPVKQSLHWLIAATAQAERHFVAC